MNPSRPLRSILLPALASLVACLQAAPPQPAPPAPPPPPPVAASPSSDHLALLQVTAPPEAPLPPESPAAFSFSTGDAGAEALEAFYLGNSSRPAPQALIIGLSEAPANLPEIREDLAVMARLLSKAVDTASAPVRHQAMGITLNVLAELDGSSRPQPIYLEGFGAIFPLKVRFPLVEPPKADSAHTDEDENPSKEAWEEARRELYGGRRHPSPAVTFGHLAWTGEAAPAEYSAERLAKLKDSLLDTLKHASNIRQLKPQDQIVVVLTGSPNQSAGNRAIKVSRTTGTRSAAVVHLDSNANPRTSNAKDSTLTLRVTKSDADAFAQGKLSLADFTKKVALASY